MIYDTYERMLNILIERFRVDQGPGQRVGVTQKRVGQDVTVVDYKKIRRVLTSKQAGGRLGQLDQDRVSTSKVGRIPMDCPGYRLVGI